MRFWRKAGPLADIGTVPAPTLIGALGGSGTRVVVRLLLQAGIFMGSDLSEAEDSKPVMSFYDVWLRRYLESEGELGRAFRSARADLVKALERHLESFGVREVGPWGVKVPRNILMLPFWHRVFPELQFVHVVRSGLDMAYSADHNQLRMVGDLVLSPEERRRNETEQAIAYWQQVNLRAADYGERHLIGRYLCLRFEDMCDRPAEAYERLRAFVSGEPAHPSGIGVEVMTPESIGRWRQGPAGEVDRLRELGAEGLRRFGYAENT